jgi:hypothetical protein
VKIDEARSTPLKKEKPSSRARKALQSLGISSGNELLDLKYF